MNAIAKVAGLNAVPLSGCLDRAPIAALLAERALIFSDTRVFVAREHLDTMAAFVAVMEDVTALPGWRAAVLADVPHTALHESAARGVFFGYDFHIDADGPKLIEINTNAGGGLLNVQLLKLQRGDLEGLPDVANIERRLVAMFVAEWQACGHVGTPGLVAIVDDAPAQQYLNPDFEMCRALLVRHGINAVICDAADLRAGEQGLTFKGMKVDLVYNRLTDFLLVAPEHEALRKAWLADAAVVTPNPRNYARYADKRHLVLLSNDAWLASIGVDAATRELIRRVVPKTEIVSRANADDLHARRKKLFFKPATGFGSKAAYRGQNVTTRVFEEILAGQYVAQEVIPAPSRSVMVDGVVSELKFDLRCYAYAGEVLLTAARLWQGQTTNFRTPGGGFTAVVGVD